MSTLQNTTVAIIGAGLTGLTTAFYLQKKGIKVTLYDKNSEPGGVIKTHRSGDFLYESGPNTGVIATPEAAELFSDLQGLCQLEIANPQAKNRWIWKGNKWQPLPSGPISFMKTPLFSIADKFKLIREPWVKPGTNPNETLDQLVLRRMGKSFLDYAVDPFISGVYAGNPSYLVTKYALPKLYNLEQQYGSFIRGAHQKKKHDTDPRNKLVTREVFSSQGGLSNLVGALVQKIGTDNIICNTQNITVHSNTSGFTIKGDKNNQPFTGNYNYIITTTSAHVLPQLLPYISTNQANTFNQLLHARVVQVAIGFNHWQGIQLKAFGGLVPSNEKRKILGILFPSSLFANRAPAQGALLSVFLGGMRHPGIFDLSDSEIISIVENECSEMLGLRKFDPQMVKIFKYGHAIPQYGASTEQRINAIAQIETEHKGLIIGGNAIGGIGMADRIKQGREMAERVITLFEN